MRRLFPPSPDRYPADKTSFPKGSFLFLWCFRISPSPFLCLFSYVFHKLPFFRSNSFLLRIAGLHFLVSVLPPSVIVSPPKKADSLFFLRRFTRIRISVIFYFSYPFIFARFWRGSAEFPGCSVISVSPPGSLEILAFFLPPYFAAEVSSMVSFLPVCFSREESLFPDGCNSERNKRSRCTFLDAGQSNPFA